MKAPAFWWRERPGAAALALAPLGALYGAVAGRRMARLGRSTGVPVLCVGNLVVGGAGKTPTALALADWLEAQGERVAFVSRGYGGRRQAAVIRVDPARHLADAVGDEPLLLARRAPCYVALDRVAAAQAAVRDGAGIVVMDDGLQNPALAKAAAIAVVDGGAGLGNGLVIPAGPLRAPARRQWKTIDLVLVIGPGAPGDAAAAEALRHGLPTVRAVMDPDLAVVSRLAGRRLVAFSGIGRPDKFFSTLAEAGLDVVRRIPFPDHHLFTAQDRASMLAAAQTFGADLVTTEKDRVRLPADFPATALPVGLRFDDPDPLDALLGRLVSGRA